MKVSLNWLREYVDIDVSVEELTHALTMLGLEIEAVERPGAEVSNVVIGQIRAIERHPDADKIVVCQTDVGGEHPLQICCGATNMKVGDKVPTAVDGATLPGGFKIGRRKMRGVESCGMMCSARELGLGEEYDGLLILDPALPVGADAKPLLGLDDVILEIEVTPNRGDWASMIGVAREIAALYGKPLRVPELQVGEGATAAASLSSVAVEAPDDCPLYLGRVLTNLSVGPSPAWLANRLTAAGQRPINNIVDITNFVLLETGQPLHAFDYDKLAEHRIVVRHARPGERMTTLDGQDRALAGDMLVIADAERPQCIAGIMGGAGSEVGEGTTKIFLESAFFRPASVRKTSRALGLISESSQRFQRGADPEMAAYAIHRAAQLIQEVAGGQVAEGLLEARNAPPGQRTVSLRFDRVRSFLGTHVPDEFQVDALNRLGFQVGRNTPGTAEVEVPPRRHDVTMETDLIEEIARLYGYDRMDVALPRVPGAEVVFAPGEASVRQLRRYLAGLGLTEVFHWTFSCPDDVRRAGLAADHLAMVALENPLSERQATLRSTLIPGLLGNVAHNLRHGSNDVAIFELGPVYRPVPNEELPRQDLRLGIALSGMRERRHWSGAPQPVDFYDIKGYVEAILASFRQPCGFAPVECGAYQTAQAAQISLDGKVLGSFGKVNKTVLQAYDIEHEVYLCELDVAWLIDHPGSVPQFQPIPAFPPSLRDLAVVVSDTVPAGDLAAIARRTGGKLLQQVEVFDVYRGKPIPDGKKSVALSLIFQSPEKTLTDIDTQKTVDNILKSLQKEVGAELR